MRLSLHILQKTTEQQITSANAIGDEPLRMHSPAKCVQPAGGKEGCHTIVVGQFSYRLVVSSVSLTDTEEKSS